ncbi:Rid family detoxifying hydrolase [Chloroflexota bacterium]
MKKQIISTDKSPKTVTTSVSQGVKVGDWIYMCGQLPLDLKTGDIIGENIEEQAEICLQYMKAVLEKVGATMDDVIKVTVLLTDMANFKAFNSVYEKYFPSNGPARDCFSVGLVGNGKILVELAAIACIGAGRS